MMVFMCDDWGDFMDFDREDWPMVYKKLHFMYNHVNLNWEGKTA